jgi:metal-dependent hydrolase (beta-lactamase superfamily II)
LPVRAQTAIGAVPEIDRLPVRVVIDSYQIAIAPSGKVGNVDIGLSLHAESRRGAQVRSVLIDFGFTGEALNNNAQLLGIDPASLDALVLSRGHYDHFGGLVGFLQQSHSKLKPGIPFFVGGEECFCARQWTAPPLAGNFGVLDRSALQAARLAVTYVQGPSLVADHAFIPGQVPQLTFEKLLSPSRMIIGVSGGLGCYPEKLPEDEQNASSLPDQFRHEISGKWPGLKCRPSSCGRIPERGSYSPPDPMPCLSRGQRARQVTDGCNIKRRRASETESGLRKNLSDSFKSAESDVDRPSKSGDQGNASMPKFFIVLSLDSGAAGALEAAHLVQSGISKRVAVFTDPPNSEEDYEFIRHGLPYDDVGQGRFGD